MSQASNKPLIMPHRIADKRQSKLRIFFSATVIIPLISSMAIPGKGITGLGTDLIVSGRFLIKAIPKFVILLPLAQRFFIKPAIVLRSLTRGLPLLWTLLSLWAFFSIFWSSHRVYTAVRLGDQLLALVVMSYLMARCRDLRMTRLVLSRALFASLLVVVSGAVSFYLFPDLVNTFPLIDSEPIHRMGSSVISANLLGGIAGVLLLLAIERYFDSARFGDKLMYGVMSLFGATVLLGARSRSAIIAVASAFLVGILLSGGKVLLFKLLMLIFGGVLGLVYNMSSVYSWFLRERSEEYLITLSGRSYLWNTLLRTIQERPISGWGFCMQGPAGPLAYVSIMQHAYGSSHNSFLQTTVGLGLVGALLFIVLHIFIAARLIRLASALPFSRRSELRQVMVLLLVVSICGITESYLGGAFSPMTWLLFYGIMLLEALWWNTVAGERWSWSGPV